MKLMSRDRKSFEFQERTNEKEIKIDTLKIKIYSIFVFDL